MLRMAAGGLRWTFRFGGWVPSQLEWELGMRCIQPEEVERIDKFMFQKDSKSSLAGRLMLRKAISEQLGISWQDIKLSRSEKGKPYLTNQVPGADKFSVNVSHHGDYTVLATHPTCQVGVDVMKTEWPRGNQPVEEFFRIMNRQFTENEWRTILQPDDEWDQLAMFHRHWCLKESYVKAVGVGISIDLQRIDFRVTSDLCPGHYVSDTKLFVDKQLKKNWRFEETMLDSTHCVVTALCLPENGQDSLKECTKFTTLTFHDLTQNSQTLGHEIPRDSFLNFAARKDRPGGEADKQI